MWMPVPTKITKGLEFANFLQKSITLTTMVLLRCELGLTDSEFEVLTITPYGHMN